MDKKVEFMILYGEYKPGFANTFAKVYSSNKTETAFEKWMDDILSNKDNLKLIKTDINNFVKDIYSDKSIYPLMIPFLQTIH